MNKSLHYAAILIAISLPAIILGRAAVAAPLILALTLVMLSSEHKLILQKSISALCQPITAVVLVVATIWAVGLLVSYDPWRSFTTELRTVLYIILIVPLWATLAQDEKRVELCLKALVISSLVLGLIAIIALYVPSSFIGTLRGNSHTPLSSLRILKESASAATLIAPLLIWAFWRLGGRWKWIGALAIAVMVAIIFLTNSRSAVAGLIGAVFIATIIYNIHRRDMKTIAFSCLACALGIGYTFYWVYATRSGYIGSYGEIIWLLPEWLIDPPRQAIWMFAWGAGEPHRWFGVGINVIDKLPGADNWNLDTGTRNIPLHPHNWLIEIAIETGLVGLVGLLGLLTYFAATKAKRYVRSGSPALLALSGVWGGYWVSGLFNFSYWSSWWQVSFLVATAICLAGDSLYQAGDKARFGK